MIRFLGLTVMLTIILGGSSAQEANVIFLHHSTGGMIYETGNVADSLEAYNQKNNTDYSITDRNFPYKPYAWANYPYDYWNIWINGYCDDYRGEKGYINVQCLDNLTEKYDVIILKHCYPGSDVLEDTGNPDIASDRKSLENYKLQYRALRDKFAAYPDNDFIIWTLVPRHRLDSDAPENAGRAKEFVDWVKFEWLKEGDGNFDNIHVFDYFSLAAEMDTAVLPPSEPFYLKYKYERSHDHKDSHPNELACKEIGPEFFRFITGVLEKRYGYGYGYGKP